MSNMPVWYVEIGISTDASSSPALLNRYATTSFLASRTATKTSPKRLTASRVGQWALLV